MTTSTNSTRFHLVYNLCLFYMLNKMFNCNFVKDNWTLKRIFLLFLKIRKWEERLKETKIEILKNLDVVLQLLASIDIKFETYLSYISLFHFVDCEIETFIVFISGSNNSRPNCEYKSSGQLCCKSWDAGNFTKYW
jgi:hypothetical protein